MTNDQTIKTVYHTEPIAEVRASMGTRINVLFAHQLSNWTCRDETLTILSKVRPSLDVVAEYWRQQDAGYRTSKPKERIAEPPFPPPEARSYFRYTGPGSFFVSINPSSVWIHIGGRWRGFLSIPKLREAHLAAFRAIAKAFEADIFYCFADNDFAQGEFWDGRGVSGCVAVLQQQFGDPIEMQESIDPEIGKATDHGCPRLWYWDADF